MNLISKSLIFVLLSFFSCKTNPTEKKGNNLVEDSQYSKKIAPREMKLLYYLGSTEKQFKSLQVANSNVEEVKYLDENMLINPKNITVDHIKLKASVELYYPEKNQQGYCYLNVEEPYLGMILNNEEGTAEFNKGLNLFLDIIRTLKRMRPNVKFGFYAIPFSTYWETKTGFFNKNDKIDLLLREVDVFFPSFYMFYDDGVVGFLKNKEYLESNTKNAIKLSMKYNKPVYPFVMHRYHPSNKKLGWQLLSDKEWTNYITTVVAYRYEDNQVNGITWWGPDSYFYELDTLEAFKKEFKGSPNTYQLNNDKQLTKKATEILKIFREYRHQ